MSERKQIFLKKDATGLTAVLYDNPDTQFHIAYSTEIGDILDYLHDYFRLEVEDWIKERNKDGGS